MTVAEDPLTTAEDPPTTVVETVVEAARTHAGHAVDAARTGSHQVAEHLPEAIERARVGAVDTTVSLQGMPDRTLQLLAVGLGGVAAGLYLGGAPRVITLAAVAPALLVCAAIATRPGSFSRRAG
ncbi:MAG: hypothetical protein ABIR11_00795 [Candidatus Limnocylindrales bacterium]